MIQSDETGTSAKQRSMCYRGFADAFRGSGTPGDNQASPQSEIGLGAFIAAFDPAVSNVACSLHESSYIKRAQSDLFMELLRWYDYFGLRRSPDAQLPDHVSVELEFMHFLTFQEHENLHDTEIVLAMRRAQKDFLSRHLMPLASAIQEACQSDDEGCVGLVADLPDFLTEDLRLLNAD